MRTQHPTSPRLLSSGGIHAEAFHFLSRTYGSETTASFLLHEYIELRQHVSSSLEVSINSTKRLTYYWPQYTRWCSLGVTYA